MMRVINPSTARLVLLPALMVLCGLAPALAQERDPTEPPAQVFGADSGTTSTSPKTPWGSEGTAVVVRDGKSYLVVDTRLYAVGQKVGPWRIERITETEVWLKDGALLRKMPRFDGIERRQAVPQTPGASSGPKPKKRRASTMIEKAKAP
ncbi:MAG: hypothetical protein RIR09_2780 [Pseudomonadota bacterium]|jgi:hypothetical protein